MKKTTLVTDCEEINASKCFCLPWATVVEHGLGLVSGVNDQPFDEICVLEDTFSEEEIVLAHGNTLARCVNYGSVKPVDLCCRHIALKFTSELLRCKTALLKTDVYKKKRLINATTKIRRKQIWIIFLSPAFMNCREEKN